MRYSQLTEDIAKDIAVFYGGRFQPMHKGQRVYGFSRTVWFF